MPRRRLPACLFATLALSTPLAAALAADTPASDRLCVNTRAIENWKPMGREAILVWTSPARRYKVTFTGHCANMKWSVFARVETRPTGVLACLTRGDVLVFGRGPRAADDSFVEESRCVIRSVEPYIDPLPELETPAPAPAP